MPDPHRIESLWRSFRRAGGAATLLAVAMAAVVADAQPTPPEVIVAEATMLPFPLTVEGLGTARANESVDIRPQVSKVVVAIRFEEGQSVEAGQVLMELENTEALADVAVARAELVDSEGQHRRSQELFKTKTVSASDLEQAAARRDADRAQLDAAKARLADSVLRAPFAGRVGLRTVSLGSLVGPETVVTTLDDTDPIKLDFEVPETAFSLLADGLPVVAHSAAWPETPFEGHVKAIDTRVDPISRTVTVRALVPNQDGRLRPGMFLTVKIVRTEVAALMVPEQSIVPEQSQQYVFVVGRDDVVEKREIRTGRRRPGQVEVVSGLAEGERVISEGTQKARPGRPVRVAREMALDARAEP